MGDGTFVSLATAYIRYMHELCMYVHIYTKEVCMHNACRTKQGEGQRANAILHNGDLTLIFLIVCVMVR